MERNYWLTHFVTEENTTYAKGVDIVEATNIPGQVTDVVNGMGKGILTNKPCVLMTITEPSVTKLLEEAGLQKLGSLENARREAPVGMRNIDLTYGSRIL